MRITGGLYRSRIVECPPGVIRPSMDRMRQSLFSILGDLTGCSFLDLFAGSGIIGIEAASRGAEPVLLVEKDYRKKQTILKNIGFVETRMDLLISPVERFLRNDQRPWDIIFLDPPFDFTDKGIVLDAACQPPHLADGGIALMHLHTAEKLPADRPGLELFDQRDYGQSRVMFWRRRGDAAPDDSGTQA
jgi:16S rRNA (guanine966-N2)-methyltransferase